MIFVNGFLCCIIDKQKKKCEKKKEREILWENSIGTGFGLPFTSSPLPHSGFHIQMGLCTAK